MHIFFWTWARHLSWLWPPAQAVCYPSLVGIYVSRQAWHPFGEFLAATWCTRGTLGNEFALAELDQKGKGEQGSTLFKQSKQKSVPDLIKLAIPLHNKWHGSPQTPARHQMTRFNLIWAHFEWTEHFVFLKKYGFANNMTVKPWLFKIPRQRVFKNY